MTFHVIHLLVCFYSDALSQGALRETKIEVYSAVMFLINGITHR